MDGTRTRIAGVGTVGPDAVALTVETPPSFAARPGQFVKVTFDVSQVLSPEAIADIPDADVDGVGAQDPEEVGAQDPDGMGAQDSDGVGESDLDGPVHVSRFYTISSPTVGDTFELTVSIEPDGTVGPVLAQLDGGDEVRVSGPFGRNYYEAEDPVVVLAGGPGVGAAVGIAERATADGNRAGIVYRDDAPIHADRLGALRDAGLPVLVVEEDQALPAAVGEVVARTGEDAQLFVYGFADFIDAATDALDHAGVPADEAKIENFG